MSHIQNRGPEVAGSAGGLLAASWILMSLRIYTRTRIVKSFGADDYLALISQLFFTGFCVCAFLGVHYGTGRHASDIPPADLIEGLKWWWMCEPMYVLGNMILKISIGIFLLRITAIKWQQITLYATIAGSTILGIWFFFMFVLQCYPSRYFWTQYIGDKGSCLDTNVLVVSNYIFCSLECLADWTYFTLPCLMVWNLQMNRKSKISASFLLGLCGVASLATLIRFSYLSGFNNKADFLWATTDVAIWAIVENGLGSCATSIATIRPLFRSFSPAVSDPSPCYSVYDKSKGMSHDSQSTKRSSQPHTKWDDTKEDIELGLVSSASLKPSTTVSSHMVDRKEIDIHEQV